MAMYPCDRCGSRYTGKQRTAYPAIVAGGDSIRRRRRLCGPCFLNLLSWMEEHEAPAELTQEPVPCAICAGPDAGHAMFLTVYDVGEARRDLYGRLCPGACTEKAALALFGTQGQR